MSNSTKYWFKRRRYGYGWVPVTWQGWLTVAGFIGALLGAAYIVKDAPDDEITREVGLFFLIVAVAIFGLLGICKAKAPKAKWRWGKQETDNPDEDW